GFGPGPPGAERGRAPGRRAARHLVRGRARARDRVRARRLHRGPGIRAPGLRAGRSRAAAGRAPRSARAGGALHPRAGGARMAVRLNKYLADGGGGSRRACDRLIAEGRVRVNDRVVSEAGTKVEELRDRVSVDGRPVGGRERPVYYVLNKPVGVITTL